MERPHPGGGVLILQRPDRSSYVVTVPHLRTTFTEPRQMSSKPQFDKDCPPMQTSDPSDTQVSTLKDGLGVTGTYPMWPH